MTYIVESAPHAVHFLSHSSLVHSSLTSRIISHQHLVSQSERHLRGSHTFRGLFRCICDTKFLSTIYVSSSALVKTWITHGSQRPVVAPRWWGVLVRRRGHIPFVLLYCLRHFSSFRIRPNFRCWGRTIPSIALWSWIRVGCLKSTKLEKLRVFMSLLFINLSTFELLSLVKVQSKCASWMITLRLRDFWPLRTVLSFPGLRHHLWPKCWITHMQGPLVWGILLA